MFEILHWVILNAKIINHKAKDGVSVVMDPQARCVLCGMIPKWIHMFHQFLVRNDPVLFDSMHALFDSHVYPPLVVYQCSKVVRINDLLWDDFQWNAHEFCFWWYIVQVLKIDIGQQIPCPWSRYHTIEYTFFCGDRCFWTAEISCEVQQVSSYC